MNINRRLSEYFLSGYREESYFLKLKSNAYMYILLIYVLFLLLFAVAMILSGEIFTNAYILPAIACSIIFILLCLLLLKKGAYDISVKVFTLFMATVTGIGLHFEVMRPETYMNYNIWLYFMMATIVITALIATRRWLTFISTLILVIAGMYFYRAFTASLLDPITLLGAQRGIPPYVMNMLLVYAISYLSISITEMAIGRAESESERNREQYDIIKVMHQSITDTSLNLVTYSEDLSEEANSFFEHSQNQAASIEEITSTAEEVSTGVERVMSGVEEQYESLEAVIVEISELSKIIVSMSEQIQSAMSQISEIAQSATRGGEILNSTNESMKHINESSSKMTLIIEIIANILEQTNLLSLNASIEAARAGEAGRGFSVVADEISKLADKTAASIKEIDALIRLNYEELKKGMVDVEGNVKTIGQIIDSIDDMRVKMNDISGQMKQQQGISNTVDDKLGRLKGKSDEIRVAMLEQKAAVNEIVKAIINVNEITQSYADGSEKLSVDARKVEEMAESLKGKIDFDGDGDQVSLSG